MENAERRPNIFDRTINSEGFERFSRKPLTIIGAVVLLNLGVGSVEGLIEAIEQEQADAAAFYAIQAVPELGVSGAVAYSDVKQLIRRVGKKIIHPS